MNKNCLIIGASGEIGKAIAQRLATEGYSLLLHYNLNNQSVNQLLHDLPEESILGFVQGDLSTSDGINHLIKQINFPISTVIYTGGKSYLGLLQNTSENTMDEMLNMHVKAPWVISKALIPEMIKQRYGKIVLITSIWGSQGASFEVVYSSVKGAQNSFIKALAKELARSGISVNGVSPGFINTKMNQNFSEEEKAEIIDQIPINRAGSPDDVANTVSFLLDDRSSYIQGEIINVTGAW